MRDLCHLFEIRGRIPCRKKVYPLFVPGIANTVCPENLKDHNGDTFRI